MASLATPKYGVRPARFRQLREGNIPLGILIFVVPLNASWFPINMRGVASLLVLQRNAFPSQQFLWRGQNPVALSKKFERMAKGAPRDELYGRLLAIDDARNRRDLDEMVKGSRAEFHYLLVIPESPMGPNLADLGLDRIAYTSDFDLYRLR
jgi:hypothetical protein